MSLRCLKQAGKCANPSRSRKVRTLINILLRSPLILILLEAMTSRNMAVQMCLSFRPFGEFLYAERPSPEGRGSRIEHRLSEGAFIVLPSLWPRIL